MCEHDLIDCPNHEGAFDCTPFCRICEGTQGFCVKCEEVSKFKSCQMCQEEVDYALYDHGYCWDCMVLILQADREKRNNE